MNFQKHQFRIYSLIALLIVAAVTIYLNQKYHLNTLETFGITAFIITALVILLFTIRKRIEKPILEYNKKMYEAQDKAFKNGLKPHKVGPKKKHTVWAKDIYKASRIYKEKIKPLEAKYPQMEFSILNSKYNNLPKNAFKK